MTFSNQLRSAAVLGCLFLACGRAEAGFLTDNVHGVYEFPTQSSVYLDGGNKAVNPTASFFFATGQPNTTVTVADTAITATFDATGSFTNAVFNGFTITDVTRNPSITGFTVSSNIAGFTSSDVSFTSDSVSVNLQGLATTAASRVEVNVQFGTAVPEPSSLALCGIAGVAGLAGARLRRRRVVA